MITVLIELKLTFIIKPEYIDITSIALFAVFTLSVRANSFNTIDVHSTLMPVLIAILTPAELFLLTSIREVCVINPRRYLIEIHIYPLIFHKLTIMVNSLSNALAATLPQSHFNVPRQP